ncbi:uncharacterized protein LOC135488263 [Lineus longissimus]|uniref:uncharacterized protein LOC135488263 n=1 Tax=Lineus longissimus TaxID=88925 RepID=UPI002B4C873B
MVADGTDDGDPADNLEGLNLRILHTRLLDFEDGVWFAFIRNMRAAGLMPNIPAGYEVLSKMMMEVFLKGFAHNQDYIGTFLQDCLPNLAPLYKANAPAETSDKSLAFGVPHCLVYGRGEELRVGPDRSRQRYRQIKQKKNCDQSRSRSRSSSPENPLGMVYREGFEHEPRHAERKRYPAEIIVKNEAISNFTESHKPDIMFIDYSHRDGCLRVKLVVEISTNVRYGRDVDFYPNYVEYATAHCVWSCFSSLQSGQTKVIGLCCFVEGFRGIKIEKTGDHQWSVHETKFVHFTNSDDVGLLLATINDEVGVADNQ